MKCAFCGAETLYGLIRTEMRGQPGCLPVIDLEIVKDYDGPRKAVCFPIKLDGCHKQAAEYWRQEA
jgi:hypothetical protein